MIEDIKYWLSYPLFTYNDQIFTLLEIMTIPLWLVFSAWFARFLISRMTNRMIKVNKDPNVIQLLKRFLTIVSIAVIFITTLAMLNIPITAFAFLSGGVAIGFGFGAKNIINNFISGWILMAEKPIRIGDFLEVEGAKGVVEEIKTRSTRIRRIDGVHMLIPNSTLLENTVVNWTFRDKLVRGVVSVGVAYGSDIHKVKNIMLDVVNKLQGTTNIDSDRSAHVYFQSFGDNALQFDVFFWTDSQVDGGLRQLSSKIRFDLDDAFKEAGISIAFPQRDLHLDGTINIISGSSQQDKNE
jgi:small-conductance mechanosensitive channel